MPTIKLAEFLNLARQRNVYGYNLKLVDMIFDNGEDLFNGAVVLDAGAGARLKHFRCQIDSARCVVGVDIAHKDLIHNSDVDAPAVASVEELPFQPSSFGCIFSVDVVEHLENPSTFFQEAARCLELGGALIVCTPNLLGYKNLITYILPRPILDLAWRVFKGRPEQPHRTYYRSNSMRQIRRISSSAGFSIEQAHYLNEVSHFFYPYPLLSVIAYLYGRCLELLGMNQLLNYMVFVLRKS